jgi:adenylyltransferase/sulfurtransferase
MIKAEDYFKRQIQLWGKERQISLESKKIAIIGAGGLGSSLSLALGTSGIGYIDIVDFDTVSLHNIHRQIAFELKDENKPKAKVVADKITSKNPFVKVKAYTIDFKEFAKLNQKYDLLLDATDNLQTREEINRYAKEKNIPWIYGSVEEFNGQVCFFDKASFEIFGTTQNQPKGITAPMVMHIASLQANLALRYLVNLPVLKDKLYYLYFDKNGELITQKFNMPT